MKKLGIIDIGSNSHRLLAVEVSEDGIRELTRAKITTRMLSGIKDGVFTPEAIAKNVSAVRELKRIGEEAGAEEFIAFATSAMRDAANRDVVAAAIREAGVDIRVLSGSEEAEMAFAGVGRAGDIGVLDIGGGSTEMLTGHAGEVAGGSAQMGAVRLTERCGAEADRQTLISTAKAVLAPVFETAAVHPVTEWVGVGGTVTTLAAMDLMLTAYDAKRIQDHPVTKVFVSNMLDTMLKMTLEERRALPGLQPQRADIICAGAAILLAFFELSGAEQVLASDSDNLMGYARKFVAASKN